MKKSYKNYICPMCWEQIPNCKCEYYSYNLLMIDEKLQDAFRILNHKGYKTTACCEGHYKKGRRISAYMAFSIPPKTNPDGWKWSGRGIYYFYKATNKKDFITEQSEAINKLNNWAKDLKGRI